MEETSILKEVLGLGVGCVLGLVAFFFYRIDRKHSEERLSILIEQDQQTRQKHTEAITELSTLLKRMNGH